MKINLNLQLELPQEYEGFSKSQLAQLLFDEVVNHLTCSHLEWATHWCCEGAKAGEAESSRYKLLEEDSQTWAKICKNAKWDFEIQAE